MDDSLKHYGTKRHSGRYPWGSGDNPEQRGRSFLGYVKKLQDEGLSEVDIAKGLDMSVLKLRSRKTLARAEIRAAMSTEALKLKEKGMSNLAISKRMGINDHTVESLLNPVTQARANIAISTANMLRDTVQTKGVIDVGLGVESGLGISRQKLDAAISLLEEEGYKLHYVDVTQQGTGKQTTLKALAPPGMEYKEVFKNRFDIKPVDNFIYSPDEGRSLYGLKTPKNVDSKRVAIRYKEDGGEDKDGVIELRRGVSDLDLGVKKYAQVRIAVDGTHFLKGMAIYADNMPDGTDIIYNSNKSKDTPKMKVFKEMKNDPDNPFGAVIKPQGQRGALNIVNEEGDWGKWSRSISSQVLSKQSPSLVKRQLDQALNIKKEALDEIAAITNPVVKKALLQSLSDDLDSSSIHLKAAALPRQSAHAILPIVSMKENEVYAPHYTNGESVVLIRHPHGGPFEIPELKVNNKNPEARRIMDNADDAIGIHPNVAKKLSGADFDGDTVLVIPNKDRLIRTAPSLKALKDFNTRETYPPTHGMTTIDGGVYDANLDKVDYSGTKSKKPNLAPKQRQMGDVSNLITDMTIKGANSDEIARAVRHSMVVIDAEKHHLDYKRSAVDNGIAALKKKYQGRADAGASTLISRSKSEVRVNERVEGKKIVDPITGKSKRLYIDPVTGRKLYENTGASFVNKDGKLIVKTTKITKMENTDDAFKLSSGTQVEGIYAQYANNLKTMANQARKLMVATPNLVYSPTAKQTYAPEVETLKAKLRVAIQNKPRERQAQLLANKIVSAKKESNPEMSKADLKKIKGQALVEARARTGASKEKIKITDREWEAIQLGAISNNVLSQIVMNSDLDEIKARATPRTAYKMSDSKIALAKVLIANGHTTAEVANALGVSTTTIQETVK